MAAVGQGAAAWGDREGSPRVWGCQGGRVRGCQDAVIFLGSSGACTELEASHLRANPGVRDMLFAFFSGGGLIS